MRLIAIQWTPSKGQLRLFGALWLPLALAAACAISFPSRRAVLITGALAAASVVTALSFPRALRYVFLGLSLLTYPIAFVASHALLAVFYFVVLTPFGLIARRVRDPMRRRFDAAASTYWIKRGPRPTPRSYFRQF